MKPIFRQNQLFTFLLYCNGQELEKNILDCGAGGTCPPLAIFAEQGYKTCGIEIDDEAIEKAKAFEKEHGLELNISKGDMRNLMYENESFSYLFSYNTIFHMSKEEINKTIGEIKRVLKPEGLAFINFLSTKDFRYGMGEKVAEGEYLQKENGGMVLHSYHEEDEAEKYFEQHGLNVVYKEVRVRTGPSRNGGKVILNFIDYIVEKKGI